ncbi:hypothetical protein [Thermus thermophilus HB8]|uniref:Uncharacterized protein n=1 Tax=Thermus thermophilus (strain ATCC 27634 / DSM 579 / HB8) TaxID=300852 RepID=Q5SGX0_THET8|nr:hypothetical protein [Thermus thermophilus HB8]
MLACASMGAPAKGPQRAFPD